MIIVLLSNLVTIPGRVHLACALKSFSEMPILAQILSSPKHLRFVIEM